jgi:hypothetical protein
VSKPRTEADLSAQLDGDLTYRLRELSDLKRAILDAPPLGRAVLLKALVALAYAHWEGSVKFSAQKYFEFLTLRRFPFSDLQPQFHANSFLVRLAGFLYSKPSISARASLIADILSSRDRRFAYIHPDLIDTGSNLKFEVFRDICLICGIDAKLFQEKESFIDVILLKRRNSIAHGGDAEIAIGEIDHVVDETIGLMRSFKNELENKIYAKAYLAPAIGTA